MYQPPRLPISTGGKRRAREPLMKLVAFQDEVLTAQEKRDLARALDAIDSPKRGHEIMEIAWGGTFPVANGESVLLIVEELNGSHLVYPPGTVVSSAVTKKTKSGCVPVLIEHPTIKPIKRSEFLRRIGPDMSKRFSRRDGPVSRFIAQRVHEIFREEKV